MCHQNTVFLNVMNIKHIFTMTIKNVDWTIKSTPNDNSYLLYNNRKMPAKYENF